MLGKAAAYTEPQRCEREPRVVLCLEPRVPKAQGLRPGRAAEAASIGDEEDGKGLYMPRRFVNGGAWDHTARHKC